MKKCVDKTVAWGRLGMSFELVRAFQRADNVRALLQVFGFLCLLVLSALAVIFSALQGWWLLFALTLYVYGGLMIFCDSAVHELTYNAIFVKKSYNLFFAGLFSFLYWRLNYAFYRTIHDKHHPYKQIQIIDGEILPPVVFTKKQFLIGLSPFTLLAFVR